MSSSFTQDCNCCDRKRQSSESELLLSPSSEDDIKKVKNKTDSLRCSFGQFVFKYRTVFFIFLWSMIVGSVYSMLFVLVVLCLFDRFPDEKIRSFPFLILYCIDALMFTFYPVSGWFADVFFGRFRTLITSLCLLLCSFVICLTCFVINFQIGIPYSSTSIALITVGSVFAFTSFIGIAGYRANIIQFGLDQLLDAPSHHQALFVHWAKWCFDFLNTVIVIICCYFSTDGFSIKVPNLFSFVSANVFFVVVLFLLLIFGCWKRHWFYSEPGHLNPYKMVVKVLKYAWKHKHPFQRSAFTYCDDEKPSRLDFAKERFGGPFTTEQVEDVKTFLRILVVLLSLGTISLVDFQASNLVMYTFGAHVRAKEHNKTWLWVMLNTGVLKNVISTLVFPVYIWIVFHLLRNHIPRILYRLGFGVLLCFAGSVSLLIIDTVGHAHYHENRLKCVFNFTYNDIDKLFYVPDLDMHWGVYIPTNILFGIGPTLVTATVFEFISAQSPHSMKGLLLGMHYAISGVYQFINSVVLLPVSLETVWINEHYPLHTGCLFWYLFSTSMSALTGVILYSIAAKWYVYRVRDDRPYDQRFVIDVYDRYLEHTDSQESSYDSD